MDIECVHIFVYIYLLIQLSDCQFLLRPPVPRLHRFLGQVVLLVQPWFILHICKYDRYKRVLLTVFTMHSKRGDSGRGQGLGSCSNNITYPTVNSNGTI